MILKRSTEFTGEALIGGSGGMILFAVLFAMRPHTYFLHGLNVIGDLIDETMLNIDFSARCAYFSLSFVSLPI